MAAIKLHQVCFLPTGTVTQESATIGVNTKQVYQRVGKRFGNLPISAPHGLQLRRHVIPFDPKSASQLLQRIKLKNAVVAWQALNLVSREFYKKQALDSGLTGYQFFISGFLRGVI